MVGNGDFQIIFEFELCLLTLLAVKIRKTDEWIWTELYLPRTSKFQHGG